MTVQSFFNQYTHLAGLTGTAMPAAREFKKTYRLKVTPIPTHRPCRRRSKPPRMFATRAEKLQAVVAEIVKAFGKRAGGVDGHAFGGIFGSLGRGAYGSSDSASDFELPLSQSRSRDRRRGRQAGQSNDGDEHGRPGDRHSARTQVVENGGLHVIATEMHSSARIDRQLIGRAARQGEPGSYQFFLSLEDELLRCLNPQKLAAVRKRARPNLRGELSRGWVRFFRQTQRRLERMHKKARKELLKQEEDRRKHYHKMGLDPYLEMTD